MLVVHTRSLFSVSPSFLLFFFSPLRPWFVLSIPEQRAWLILIQLAGWSHISLDKLSGPQQQQLKVLLLFFNHLLVCSLDNLFNLYLFLYFLYFILSSSQFVFLVLSSLLVDVSYLEVLEYNFSPLPFCSSPIHKAQIMRAYHSSSCK